MTVIGQISISKAGILAIKEAVHGLDSISDSLLVDAFKLDLNVPQFAIDHGDARSVSLVAASIIAKVHRDALMLQYEEEYPG